MKNVMTFVGLILILFGIVAFSYGSYTYATQEKVAEIGSIKVTAQQDKTVSFPPLLSGLSIAAGVVLVVLSRIGRSK